MRPRLIFASQNMRTVAAEMKPSVLKIVIVDDSPLIVGRLKQALEPMTDIEISGVAGDIGSAFGLIEEKAPHVVILDIYLEDDAPKASGLNLLAVITEGFPAIKVIMLTNLSGPQYRNKCLKMGAAYFLDKTDEFEKVPEILTGIIYSLNLNEHK